MAVSNQPVQPYYMEFLRCAQCLHEFEYENPLYHPLTLPMCGHTMCRGYHVSFGTNHTPIDQLPTNYALLTILYAPSRLPERQVERHGQCPSYMQLDKNIRDWFDSTDKLFNGISCLIKPILKSEECQSIFSPSMIRKLFSLLNSQYIDCEGRLNVVKAMRSLAEQLCIDFTLHHQNPQQLTHNLQAAIGLRDGQVLEQAQGMNSFPGTIAAFATAIDGKYAQKKCTILKNKFTEFSNMIVQVNYYNQAYDSSWTSMKRGLVDIKGLLKAFIELKKKNE